MRVRVKSAELDFGLNRYYKGDELEMDDRSASILQRINRVEKVVEKKVKRSYKRKDIQPEETAVLAAEE